MSNEPEATDKPSILVDMLVSLWVVFVAVMYYGGYAVPAIGLFTGIASSIYGAVLIVAVVAAARRYLSARPNPSSRSVAEPIETEKR